MFGPLTKLSSQGKVAADVKKKVPLEKDLNEFHSQETNNEVESAK